MFQLNDGRTLSRQDLLDAIQRARHEGQATASTQPSADAIQPEAEELEAVLDAAVLGALTRGAAGMASWLQVAGRQRANGTQINPQRVRACLRHLHAQGLLLSIDGQGYSVDLADERHQRRLQSLLLNREQAKRYWRWTVWLYCGAAGSPDRQSLGWLSWRHPDEPLHLLRQMLFSGMSAEALDLALDDIGTSSLDSPGLLIHAATQPWLPDLFETLDPTLVSSIGIDLLLQPAHPATPLVCDWLQARFDRQPQALDLTLRLCLGLRQQLDLEMNASERLLAPLEGLLPEALRAARALLDGRLAAAREGFEQTLKAARSMSKQRKQLLPDELLQLHVLSLVLSPDAEHWSLARKFCLAEAGSRKPNAGNSAWGLWAHAIAVRLGDERLITEAFHPESGDVWSPPSPFLLAQRLIAAAWLGRGADAWTAAHLQALRNALSQQRRHLWRALLNQAAQRLGLPEDSAWPAGKPQPAALMGGPREAWRDALSAIMAMKPEASGPGAADKGCELCWSLTLDEQGRPVTLEPRELSHGARGPGKLKPLSLGTLQKRTGLHSRDAALLRHIQRIPHGTARDLYLDPIASLPELLGHPRLMLSHAPGQWLELLEAQPELQLLQIDGPQGPAYRFVLQPSLLFSTPPRLPEGYWSQDERQRLIDHRNSLLVQMEGPQRARLIRIQPAQRRVAELLAEGWTVPASAQAELASALQVLSAHFEVHSDAQAGRPVPGDSRLRVQLSPLGGGLQMQLLVRPFAEFGPLVAPGQGRARLMCMHEGESLTTERDLPAERAHRQALLQALPFLDAGLAPELPWQLDDAEQALQVLERLPDLPGVAGVDWPKGKALRLHNAARHGLQLQVQSQTDWLALNGELRVDEARVLSLQTLLGLLRESSSRFVSLGDGEYLALSEQLRQQLQDLDALGQEKKGALQLPLAATPWLEQQEGLQLSGDRRWRERVDRLAAAADLQAAPPAALQAELRGYQLDGYRWMMRLAEAGLGACLADDMGLGKTIQTLALLLTRADTGPALVLAPTSVCANWAEEAGRFAPGLRAQVYSEAADRRACIEQQGPGDLLIASYALAQQDAEAFAARSWTTLVMDEAQALKNAATKRARSVAELEADFKLALSGTPVENRLAELWSVMNLINSGLLGPAAQFQQRFAGPIERQQDPAVRQRLRRIIAPFLLRRTKAQVLQDLPPRTEILHLVQPSEEEHAFNEALRRQAQQKVSEAAQQQKGAQMQVLAELMKLRRAACDPRLVAPELQLSGAKLAEFERLVLELVEGQHKALVFSQFTDYLQLLAARLDELGLRYQYLDGSTPAAERARRVAAFQKGDGELFLISLKAGGFGLNLTMADYVLIVDPWWNPAAEDQATGRAHRMGQQRPVTVYRLVTAGSVEERILALHRDKRGLAEGMLEGQDGGTVLTAAALAALLED